jgi:predicted nicotinamide N-methyase
VSDSPLGTPYLGAAHDSDRDNVAVSLSPPPLTYGPVPYVPEVSIFQAPAGIGLWDGSGGAYHSDRPPPFWAFAWAGGQALARYVIDHPDLVSGRTVVDVGAGSGLVGMAAARSGAARVRAVDADLDAVDAIRRNAAAAGLVIDAVHDDILSEPFGRPDLIEADVLLVGDLFYTGRVADRAMRFLRRAERSGARVLTGDAGRGFLPVDRFERRAAYEVPTSTAIEVATITRAVVWELRRSATVGGTSVHTDRDRSDP